jgi:hypothetical protein
MPGAIDAYRWLNEHSKLAVYIFTAPSIPTLKLLMRHRWRLDLDSYLHNEILLEIGIQSIWAITLRVAYGPCIPNVVIAAIVHRSMYPYVDVMTFNHCV